MKILFSYFLLLSTILFAQEANAQKPYEDVIYLKDGSVLRGKVLPEEDSNTVKIQIYGGSIFVVQDSTIERTTYEPKFRHRNIDTSQLNLAGPVVFLELGLWGNLLNTFPEISASLRLGTGYDINENVQIGFINALNSYGLSHGKWWNIDAYGQVNLLKKGFNPQPYIRVQGGYRLGFSLEGLSGLRKKYPGYGLGAGIGIRGLFSNKVGYHLGIEARNQILVYENRNWDDSISKRTHSLFRSGLQFAIEF